MRVFIDTNILIDFVVNREGFSEDADKLFALGITGDIKLMTSALSYVTAMYIAHKYEYQDVKETLLAVPISKLKQGGPIPHNMARVLMPRQPYSVAVLSTGGRLHP